VGNKHFRETIAAALDEYMKTANRFEKSLVVHRIVDQIQAQGGRFLKRDTRLEKWYELTPQQAKEKVGHAIRDAANLTLSRQHKQDDTESGSEGYGGAGRQRGAQLKSPPPYAQRDHDFSTRKLPAKRRRTPRQEESVPASIHQPFPVEAPFESPFSQRSLMQSTFEQSSPQSLNLTGDFSDPVFTDSTVASLQPDLSQYPIQQLLEYRRRQQAYRQRQEAQLSQQDISSIGLSSNYPSYAAYPGMTNRPFSQNFEPALPVAPYDLDVVARGNSQRTSATLGSSLGNVAPMMYQVPPDMQQQFPILDPAMTLTDTSTHNPHNPGGREQMILQQRARDLYFQQQHEPRHRTQDDNDHFLEAINAVLGPMGSDTEDSLMPAQNVSTITNPNETQYLLRQQQQLDHQRRQHQHPPEEKDSDSHNLPPRDHR
jgi:hypothetical protein